MNSILLRFFTYRIQYFSHREQFGRLLVHKTSKLHEKDEDAGLALAVGRGLTEEGGRGQEVTPVGHAGHSDLLLVTEWPSVGAGGQGREKDLRSTEKMRDNEKILMLCSNTIIFLNIFNFFFVSSR